MSKRPFGFEVPEDSPGFLLWQTTIIWQRMIKKALKAYDVTHSQFVIMAILLWWHVHQKEVTQVEIVDMSKLDKMTVSQSLKKLVGMGLVIRTEHTEDTRAKSVRLTKKGATLANKLVPIVESIDEKFFGHLPKKQEEDLIVALHRLALLDS